MKNISLFAVILMTAALVSCGGKDKSSSSNNGGFTTSQNGYSTTSYQTREGKVNYQTGVLTFGSQSFDPRQNQVSGTSISVIQNAFTAVQNSAGLNIRQENGQIYYRIKVSAATTSYNGATVLDIRSAQILSY